MNETIQTLLERRSIRKYQEKQVDPAQLDQILEAGLYAASGKNKQSTLMVVVQDAETVGLLSRLNARVWGKQDSDPFYGAPTCVIVLADAASPNAIKDGSLVIGNLMTAAWSLGVGSCWINRAQEQLETEEGRTLMEKWGLDPEKYVGVGNCVLGYLDGEVPAAPRRKDGRILRV